MMRRVMDLGFALAVIEEREGEAMFTLMVPETDEDEPKCIYVIGAEGLRNMVDGVSDALNELEAEADTKARNERRAGTDGDGSNGNPA